MINDIINGIAAKLHQDFGDGYKIYKESIPQGFKEPCFAIVHVETIETAKLPNRYLRVNKFDVHFFPSEGQKQKEEMYAVAEQMYLSLEYINVLDNLARGAKMSSEIVDGVLHFFVNYDVFIKKLKDGGPHMTELKSNIIVEE